MGMKMALRMMIPPLVAKRIVVMRLVSFAPMNRAAKRTPKLMTKLTNDDILRFIVDASSYSSESSIGRARGAFTFFALGARSALTGLALAALTGLALAAAFFAFALGLVSSLSEAAALSSSPMLFTRPCSVRQCSGRFRIRQN